MLLFKSKMNFDWIWILWGLHQPKHACKLLYDNIAYKSLSLFASYIYFLQFLRLRKFLVRVSVSLLLQSVVCILHWWIFGWSSFSFKENESELRACLENCFSSLRGTLESALLWVSFQKFSSGACLLHP